MATPVPGLLLVRIGLACATLAPALTAAQPWPAENRIYALEGGVARVQVEAAPGTAWRVRDAAGREVRALAPADADAALRVPLGGWYRLERRDPDGRMVPVGGRFAAGLVVLVTGQSQADSLFYADRPEVGAYAVGPADPPLPPVAALLLDCRGEPGCGPGGVTWREPGQELGTRLLLAELAARLGPVPLAVANAAWGGATAAALADPAEPAGERLRRVAHAAAPASAAIVLAHGTTDAFVGTAPSAYATSLRGVIGVLRNGGLEGMPVLIAPLTPLEGSVRLLGSRKLAAWALPARSHWAAPWPLALVIRLPPEALAQAAAIRGIQARMAAEPGCRPGGDMSMVGSGPDGVHWSAEGARRATREAAAALAGALQGSDRRRP